MFAPLKELNGVALVDVPADSRVVIEKPINLVAVDKLEAQASQTSSIDVFASILEMT